MNHEKFIKKLIGLGIYISKDNYQIVKKRILERLRVINTSAPLPVKFLKTKKYLF